MADARKKPRLALACFVTGGGAALLGCIFPWYRIRGGVIVGANRVTGLPGGWETSDGLLALILVGGAILLGILGAFTRLRRVAGLLVLAGAIVAGILASQSMRHPQAGYIDYAVDKASSPQTPSAVRSSLEQLFELSQDRPRTGSGPRVVIAGAGVLSLGALGLLIGPRTRQRMETRDEVLSRAEDLVGFEELQDQDEA